MKLITWSSPSPAFAKRLTNLSTTWGELGLGFKSEETFKAQGVCQVACSLPGVSSSKLGTCSLNQPWKWLAQIAKAQRKYELVGSDWGWGHDRNSTLCSLLPSLGWGEENEVYPLEADPSALMTMNEAERTANAQICKCWCYEVEAGAIFRLMLL